MNLTPEQHEALIDRLNDLGLVPLEDRDSRGRVRTDRVSFSIRETRRLIALLERSQ